MRVTVLLNKPKTSEKDWPRGDVDNYAKGILDACNGVLWADDDSIVHLITTKLWTTGNPLILLSVKTLTAKQLESLRALSAANVEEIAPETILSNIRMGTPTASPVSTTYPAAKQGKKQGLT